ncbi:hypothetical protein JA1_001107 [Spathaspora sp. JA1]|nr:hypothetical protein JA1_001107 [Spathaspora sp. JA1]
MGNENSPERQIKQSPKLKTIPIDKQRSARDTAVSATIESTSNAFSDNNSNGSSGADADADADADAASDHSVESSSTISRMHIPPNPFIARGLIQKPVPSPEATASQALAVSGISPPIKNPHRTKLSNQDIKLILYLIIQIKPFKYIGNRAWSQTKKWEVIQEKYYEIRYEENKHRNFVVPTIRTLQRQLAAALKKATIRRSNGNSQGIPQCHTVPSTLEEIEHDDYYDFEQVIPDSSLAELEDALFDLHEVSERIKQIKFNLNATTNNRSDVGGSPSQPGLAAPLSSSSIQNIIDTSLADATSPTIQPPQHQEKPSLSSSIGSPTSIKPKSDLNQHAVIDHIQNLRNDLTTANTTGNPDNFSRGLDMLESVLKQTIELHQVIHNENEAFKKEIDKLTKDHLRKISEMNQTHLIKQRDLNRQFLDLFKTEFETRGNSEHILARLTSLEALLE